MTNHMQWDTIIIGSGIAGLSAAIEAKQLHTRVCVIEKLPAPGGNSIISDGGIAVVGSDLQKKFTIEDSVDCLVNDMLRAGEDKNDSDLVRLIARRSNDAYEWSKTQGVRYLDRVDFFGGHSVARCLTPTHKKGKDIVDALYARAIDLGVVFMFKETVNNITLEGTTAVSLRTFNSKTDQETIHTINDRVVVATGGFGSDKAMIEKYDKRLSGLQSTNLPSARGDMLKRMETLGAALIDMGEIQCGPWASPDEKGFGIAPLFGDYVALPHGVLINPSTASRFVNEHADRKVLTDAMLFTAYVLGIADADMVEKSGWSIEPLVRKGIVRSFDSLEAIAKDYEMDVSMFLSTIETYNKAVRLGAQDAFGKTLKHQAPFARPPYYVMRTVAKVHHTMGGLKITTDAHVMRRVGGVFANIYAAGECTGGVHGRSRLGSMAITECMVMGRIAGKGN